MDNRIENIILFIAKNFNNELVLDNLAAEVNLSKFHFHRLFKEETGQTPLLYINKIRLEHAAHFLIMYPTSKQLDVAFECGYSSPAVFTRAFKNFYNTKPSLYRKENSPKSEIRNHLSEELIKLPITYLEKKTIDVHHSNLSEENITNLYKRIIGIIDKPTNCFGIYIDAPFHKPLNECRYYAGIENDGIRNNATKNIEIEDGYYTYLDVQGDFDSLSKQIIEFKEKVIDPSHYFISSLIAFEKIKLPINYSDFNYFSIKRTIYIRIKRK